jgi:hypothetical protein
MKLSRKLQIYRCVILLIALFCGVQALSEWFMAIPLRHYYFPTEIRSYESFLPLLLLAICIACITEAIFLSVFRAFNRNN